MNNFEHIVSGGVDGMMAFVDTHKCDMPVSKHDSPNNPCSRASGCSFYKERGAGKSE